MKKNRRKISIVFGLMLITLINMFYISKTTVEAVNNKKVKSVTVKISGRNVTKQKYIADVGDIIKLNIKVTPKQAKKSISFVHYRGHILSNISKKGKVRAVGGGTAKITVTVKAKNGKKKKTWVKIKVRDEEEDIYIPENSSSGNSNSSESSSAFGDPNFSESNSISNGSETFDNSLDHQVSNSNNENGDSTGNIESNTASNVNNSESNTYVYDNNDDFARAVSELIKSNYVKDNAGVAADKFLTGRLIVKGDGSNIDFSNYNPITVLKNNDNIYVLQFTTNNVAKQALSEIKKLPNVKWAEEDFYGEVLWEDGSNIQNIDSKFLSWGVSKMGADLYAQSIQGKGKGVIVAVIDTGVANHEFLSGRIGTGYDFVDNDSDPSNDLNSHGTHVTGTIVDCTPDLPVYIMPIRVFDADGYGSSLCVALGIRYAADLRAEVINLSLRFQRSECIDEAVEYAINKGSIVVAAAGNENADTENYSPAHLQNAIIVGAVNENDEKANFSNIGNSLDVVAPGERIKSCIPTGYDYKRGTSMATPHVAAIAAMFKIDDPSLTPAQIEQKIKMNTRDLGEQGWDPYFGYGIPDLSRLVNIEPTNILLTPINTDGKIPINSTVTLNAIITPDIAVDKNIIWYSSNSSVAVVNNGIITGISKGSAIITAMTSNGLTASYQVEVYNPSDLDPKEITALILNKSNIRIQVGIFYPLTATIVPENALDKNVVWESSNPDIATVDNGMILGRGEGTAIITATTKNGITASCSVTVYAPSIWDPIETPADNSWDPVNEKY